MKALAIALISTASIITSTSPAFSLTRVANNADFVSGDRYNFYQCGYIIVPNSSLQWLQAIDGMDCISDPSEANSTPIESSSSGGNGSSQSDGNCDTPDQEASDGSRCGGRAASERPGGR